MLTVLISGQNEQNPESYPQYPQTINMLSTKKRSKARKGKRHPYPTSKGEKGVSRLEKRYIFKKQAAQDIWCAGVIA